METTRARTATIAREQAVAENLPDLGGRPQSTKTILVETLMEAHAAVGDGRAQFTRRMHTFSQKVHGAKSSGDILALAHEVTAEVAQIFDETQTKIRKLTRDIEFGAAA